MMKDYFLATTALSQYWDRSKHIIFLGSHCLRFSQKHEYEHLSYVVLDDIWQDKTVRKKAQIYIEEVYSYFLNALQEELNSLHGMNKNLRYYEIIIGPWLRVYLTVLYDRYTSLELAYTAYPKLSTIGYVSDTYSPPLTNGEFVNALATDEYNLKIYSDILKYLKRPFKYIHQEPAYKHRDPNLTLIKPFKEVIIKSLREKIKDYIRGSMQYLFLLLGKKDGIIIADSGISFPILVRFFILSKFKIVPITNFPQVTTTLDRDSRKSFAGFEIGRTEFEKCASQLLINYLPIAYLEAFPSLNNWACNYKIQPRIIFSAMGWHYNERFKYLAAHLSEQNKLLYGHQHGGDYGILSYHIAERHEIKVSDKFYTWGWQHHQFLEKCVPLSSFKLRRKITKKKIKVNYPILYGCANSFRFIRRLSFSSTAQLKYYQMQKAFITMLSATVLSKLQVRLYHKDWGWDRKERWQAINPNIRFQSSAIAFPIALANCDLYIADHISTTFVESFSVNKPTLLFCDADMWEIREEAKPYFEELKKVNVFFHDAKEAAKQLNNIHGNISNWWFEIERQAAINNFRQRFAQPASANLCEWKKEFARLLLPI